MSIDSKRSGVWIPLLPAGFIVWAFFFDSYGPGQVIVLWVPWFAAASAIFGLIQSARASQRLKALPWGLALVVAAVPIVRVNPSLVPARAYALEVARHIQGLCVARGACPDRIEGWEPRKDRYQSQTLFDGSLLDWPVRYHTDGRSFEIELYICLDMMETWKGGVDLEEVVKVR
jgi:hypothetical protein